MSQPNPSRARTAPWRGRGRTDSPQPRGSQGSPNESSRGRGGNRGNNRGSYRGATRGGRGRGGLSAGNSSGRGSYSQAAGTAPIRSHQAGYNDSAYPPLSGGSGNVAASTPEAPNRSHNQHAPAAQRPLREPVTSGNVPGTQADSNPNNAVRPHVASDLNDTYDRTVRSLADSTPINTELVPSPDATLRRFDARDEATAVNPSILSTVVSSDGSSSTFLQPAQRGLGLKQISRVDHSLQYLRPPSDYLDLKTVCLALPTIAHNKIDLSDAETQEMLNKIRRGCKVWINVSKVDENMLLIKTEDISNMPVVVDRIREMLTPRHSDAMWQPFFLVQPPTDGNEISEVRLVKAPNGRFLFDFKKAVGHIDQDQAVTAQILFVEKFRSHLDKITHAINTDPHEMRMRVHLGKVGLKSKKKGQDVVTYNGFTHLIDQAGKRGVAVLEQKIGGGGFGAALHEMILQNEAMFIPTTPQARSLSEVVSHQYLVLFIKGFRVEMEVRNMKLESEPQKLFHTRAFRHDKGNKLEINTVCPGRLYDWKLEVLADTGKIDTPAIRAMRDQLQVRAPAGRDEFPVPYIPKPLADSIGLEKIVGKTVWTFGSSSTPYLIDVSLYHEWPGNNFSVPPVKECGLSIYGVDWDDTMQAATATSLPRDFGYDYSKLFGIDNFNDGFLVFLTEIDDIQRLLQEAIGLDEQTRATKDGTDDGPSDGARPATSTDVLIDTGN